MVRDRNNPDTKNTLQTYGLRHALRETAMGYGFGVTFVVVLAVARIAWRRLHGVDTWKPLWLEGASEGVMEIAVVMVVPVLVACAFLSAAETREGIDKIRSIAILGSVGIVVVLAQFALAIGRAEMLSFMIRVSIVTCASIVLACAVLMRSFPRRKNPRIEEGRGFAEGDGSEG